jgi:hypothetical protein
MLWWQKQVTVEQQENKESPVSSSVSESEKKPELSVNSTTYMNTVNHMGSRSE